MAGSTPNSTEGFGRVACLNTVTSNWPLFGSTCGKIMTQRSQYWKMIRTVRQRGQRMKAKTSRTRKIGRTQHKQHQKREPKHSVQHGASSPLGGSPPECGIQGIRKAVHTRISYTPGKRVTSSAPAVSSLSSFSPIARGEQSRGGMLGRVLS